jgi:hypothetical protein
MQFMNSRKKARSASQLCTCCYWQACVSPPDCHMGVTIQYHMHPEDVQSPSHHGHNRLLQPTPTSVSTGNLATSPVPGTV